MLPSGRYVGRRVPRWEDRRFVQGRGRYLDDLNLPDQVEVAFVRSPHAHARLLRVDVEAARGHPEAVGVYTWEDLQGLLRPYWTMPRGPIRQARVTPLASGKVRWVGEPVAVVAARDRYVAEDLCELVTVEYEPLPAVVDALEAMRPEAIRLYEEWPDNVVSHQTFQAGDPEAQLAGCAVVVRERFRSNRVTAVPLEGRGILARWDPLEETLTVWMGHQDVHLVRAVLSEVLGLPLGRIRVISPDVGGAFGIKLPVYPEEMVVCALARILQRPVKWVQDRRESLLGDTHAREAVVDVEAGFDAEGQLRALWVHIVSDAGAYAVAGRGPVIEGSMLARELPGPYDLRHYAYTLDVVMTNKAPVAVYRGVAIPVSTFVMERVMDLAADALKLDPAEIRRRNLVRTFPYSTVTGHVYDAGRYLEGLEKVLELVDYRRWRAEQAQLRAQGRYLGIGICCLVDATARGGGFYGRLGLKAATQEGCILRIDPAGGVTAALGTTTQGQGLHTALAQLIADTLGVPLERVTVVMGDTATTPYGGGAWASRGAVAGGAVALLAARRLREKVQHIAAHLLEAAPEDIELADGRAFVRGAPTRSLSLEEIAHTAYFVAADLPRGMEPGLEVMVHWEPEIPATFAYAAQAMVVEVQPETGAVDILKYVVVEDCGPIINPGLVDGQLRGGILQGLGQALYEDLVYDAQGQLLTSTLMDYILPGIHEAPEIEIHHMSTPSPRTVGGLRGMAESGTAGAPAVLANAVADALKPFGAAVTALPLSPARVVELIRKGRERTTETSHTEGG
ncbi:MAG: xanthine dehydrogenase family protein molybdopterin-binding subunit [Armatimonadota bacterium]|nr:xanthine dehydrogenase family protein molybdopterin-binding subunit [Armatimonadota bacterium]MDR7570233.1 xanthine dehydrogenase family protein molybdopterin-binding subunit [Armatimonadota bacterium]MDR7615571.1 xanthine dehydrogenase family protein molybdopterin-binding subunit [Armatimonadota bacterium]